MDQQVKLLHVLETGHVEPVGSSQSRPVDVRLVAATNSDLKQSVADGEFRKDLFFRLNTVEVHIPPLGERADDIAPLADHFLDLHRRKYTRPEIEFSVEASALLRDSIAVSDLNLDADGGPFQGQMPLMPIDDAERLLITTALERFDGNVVKAAQALGLSRSAFYRRLEKYGMDS
jgi:DNA-binding NtrC family response regulator